MILDEKIGQNIFVRGIVQGVGFRPFVYAQAIRYNLTGWVRNTSSGVEIEVNGLPQDVNSFLDAFNNTPPPLARIDTLVTRRCPASCFQRFEIINSLPVSGEFMPVSPDMSICDDCLRELLDPNNRRFRYPFINCTNCGPRFTIIKDTPYDRPNTTMAVFSMCPSCQSEYENPLDRRFHAQPIACSKCGPTTLFESRGQILGKGEESIQIARQWIKQGKIIALKGLGGYHLVCDALNPDTVSELRRRKKRSDKPFAVMSFDLNTIRRHCHLTQETADLLLSPQHPIVLLDRSSQSTIAHEVAPNQYSFGFMLPYTPLHFLITEPESGFPDVLVMTSGNQNEEPIAYEDSDAINRLSHLADGFLLHNRAIHMRVDDSVTRVIDRKKYFLRRSRGYAPDPIKLPHLAPQILAVGAELKNTFCLTRDTYGFIGHYIGDLENYETMQSFEEGIEHFERLFRITPQIIACDLHPDYLSTQYACKRSNEEQIRLVNIQHHHAHLAACLADNGWEGDEKVIGLCFDGTGFGIDGNIWGGEFLLGSYSNFSRKYHLKYVPMPGGNLSVFKPARMALAYLSTFGFEWEDDLPPVNHFSAEERKVIRMQLTQMINTPLTSSMGRLFDAAASLLNIRHSVSYEGQAAIEMENIADPAENAFYRFDICGDTLDPLQIIKSIITERRNGISVPKISARFHNSLVQLILTVCQRIQKETGCRTVALSGGVWQNRFLLERTLVALRSSGFEVMIHRQVPPNDACISLGQAMVLVYKDLN